MSTIEDRFRQKFMCVANGPYSEDADDVPEGMTVREGNRYRLENEFIPALEKLFDDGIIAYAIGSWEIGSNTGRLHVQFYVQTTKPCRPGYLGAKLPHAEVDRQKKTDTCCIEYCYNPAKEGFVEKAFEMGTPLGPTVKQTKMEVLRDEIMNGDLVTYKDCLRKYPTVCQSGRAVVQEFLAMARDKRYVLSRRAEVIDTYIPNAWQYWVEKKVVDTEPDDRTVLFVCDLAGKSGKSLLSTRLQCLSATDMISKNVQILRPTKLQDMARKLDPDVDILLIDIPRKIDDSWEYLFTFLEQVKDRLVSDSKYDGVDKLLRPCHVVVFTNEDVKGNSGYLTHDRYEVMCITPELKVKYNGTSPPICPLVRMYNQDGSTESKPIHPCVRRNVSEVLMQGRGTKRVAEAVVDGGRDGKLSRVTSDMSSDVSSVDEKKSAFPVPRHGEVYIRHKYGPNGPVYKTFEKSVTYEYVFTPLKKIFKLWNHRSRVEGLEIDYVTPTLINKIDEELQLMNVSPFNRNVKFGKPGLTVPRKWVYDEKKELWKREEN